MLNCFIDKKWSGKMKAHIGPWVNEGERDISIELDKWDSWNVDYTLAVIAAPLLRQLRSESHSYGCVDSADVPADVPTCEDLGTVESWHWVMDEMIWAFTSVTSESDGDTDITERHKNALRLFGKYYFSLWD